MSQGGEGPGQTLMGDEPKGNFSFPLLHGSSLASIRLGLCSV